MTVGPMPCMTCGRKVWYAKGQMWSPYWGVMRVHSCRDGLNQRRFHAEHNLPGARAAHQREWQRRKRAAA